MSTKRIGFIGVGLMGHGMAKNLITKGYPLTIMGNRNREPVESLKALGAREVKTPAEVAATSDMLFLCLTDSSTVEKVVRGPDGIGAGGKPGLIVIDCTSANPVSTLQLAAELKEKGITLCDAPLNGTPVQAEAGQLSLMIGADNKTFAAIKPVCEAVAAKIVHLGPVGDGHKMKLLNNFVAMGYAALYSEALTLARKVGITPATFDSVLRGSRMDCGFYQTYFKYVLEGDRNAHKFTLVNALKDLRYLEAMADDAKIANPIGNAVKNSYATAVNAGRGEDYVPMLSEVIAKANGLE
jgi:3-hydroxyisobutyrate dehydrogenase-like beta-hydroxyacid dehydrogenase